MEKKQYHFKELTSTNDWIKEHRDLIVVNQLLIVSADAQTAGRGRGTKSWHSNPYENVLISYGLICEALDVVLMSMMTTIVQHVLQSHDIIASIKAPNDLLVEGKKIAGILHETIVISHGVGKVIGLGLNVNQINFSHIDQPATSMSAQTHISYDVASIREQITQALLVALPKIT